MVAIDVIDTTIRATDRIDNVVEVETVGWDETEPVHSFPMHVDGQIAGRVTELTAPASFAQIASLESGQALDRQPIEPGTSSFQPNRSTPLLTAESAINVRVRFDGPATIELDENDTLGLSFDQPTPVTIGFESSVTYPRHTITVPRTTDGVAAAISHFSASVRETSPARSANHHLRHPPRIAYGDGYDVPDAVAEYVPDTGLELVVPDRLAFLLPAAPLSYYLGCRVVTDDVDDARIRTADGTILAELGSLPAYQYAVAALLRRIFLVDSLVRYDQISSGSPVELDVLSLLDFDPATFVRASDVERLRACLELDFERVSPSLPEWHAVSYVEPTYEHARGLPYLVRNLSVVMLPDAAPGRADPDGRHEALRRQPETTPARAIHGEPHGSALAWLSSDRPPAESLFVPDVEGYEGAIRFLDRRTEEERVVIVCNDDGRRAAARTGADLFDAYGPDDVDVTVRRDVSREELRDVFEAGGDLLHFVGDVDAGFACPDGSLDPSTIERSNVRLVFLDGEAGFETGRTCLRRGSVAAIAWNRSAASGTRSAESATRLAESATRSAAAVDRETRERLLGLLTRGFTVDQAVRYAVGPDASASLRALGDAFVQFTQPTTLYSFPATVDSVGVDGFEVRGDLYIPKAGFIWRPGLDDVPAEMCAQPVAFAATGPQLATIVETENVVPIVDDEIHWKPDEHPFYPFV